MVDNEAAIPQHVSMVVCLSADELKQKLIAAEVPAIVKNLQSHSEAKVQTAAKALSSVLDK